MKKKTILSCISCAVLMLLTACSNDDITPTEKSKVDATKAIEFKVDFADYNSEQQVDMTRAGGKAEEAVQQTIDLGNGIVAQCTLQRDTTQRSKAARTRALENDTYTMLAYDPVTHALKGEVTGTVTWGVFTPTSSNPSIFLAPGTYEFVLYNSKFTRSGNNLTVTRANAGDAYLGRTTYTVMAAPTKQSVAFTMKRVGASVKIKLTGYMDFTGVTGTLSSVNSTAVPGSSTYDASTGTWTTGTGAAMSASMTFNGGYEYSSKTYIASTNDGTAFMPSTDVSKLKLTFTGGNIYNINMAGASLTFNPASTLKLDANGAYVLNVNIMYHFLYLMSDGSRGFIEETTYGGGTKTPIAVVLSQSKHLAIALQDANHGNPCAWTTRYMPYGQTHNKDAKTVGYDVFSLFNGYSETWDASASTDNTTIKGTSTDYPAFKAAGDYTPTLPIGVHLTGKMVGKKWHLPSAGEWVYALTSLGFGKASDIATGDDSHGQYIDWYADLADKAFTQVGGVSFLSSYSDNKYYHSSSEYTYWHGQMGIYAPLHGRFRWWGVGGSYVRPFINYDE